MINAISPDKKSFVLTDNSTEQWLEIHHLSHDLRGPLNSILGFAELLLEGIEGPLNENQMADITAIYQSSQNLLSLINSMVDLSKLEANRLPLTFKAVKLNEIVKNILAFDFGTLKPSTVTLIANLPHNLPTIQGDPPRIEQMLMNLVQFVFKLKKSGPVFIEATYNENFVTIYIKAGEMIILPDELETIFQLAVITDSTGRRKLTRGGLQLPLTRQLANKHNGQVWVESNEHAGTKFHLKLPRSDSSLL